MRPRTRHVLVVLASTLAAPVFGTPARAQSAADSPTERARQLYNAGAAAYGVGQYAAAVQAFSGAYSIEPRVSVLFSLAQAERHLFTEKQDPSILREAVQHYRRYLELVPQGGRRVDATDALVALEPELRRVGDGPGLATPKKAATRIMVWTSTKDAVIAIDGTEHTESPVVEEVGAGPHVVRTKAPGYFPDERTVTSIDGNLVSAEVTLRERPATIHVDAPAGTEVTIDGRPLGDTPVADVDVPAGTHLVGLSRVGHVAELRTIVVERGDTARVKVSLPTTLQRRIAVGTLVGAGAAAVAGAVFLGVTFALDANAKKKYDEATAHNFGSAADLNAYDDVLSQRDSWKSATITAFGIGAGLLVLGSALFFLDHPRPEASPSRVGADPTGVHVRF